jgi:hypothetical protein
MSDFTPCDSYKAAAIQCVATDTTGTCSSCIDLETFATEFPDNIKTLFASTQAFAIPGTPSFCNVANDRICAEVEGNWSCCCKEQVTGKKLFKTHLSVLEHPYIVSNTIVFFSIIISICYSVPELPRRESF